MTSRHRATLALALTGLLVGCGVTLSGGGPPSTETDAGDASPDAGDGASPDAGDGASPDAGDGAIRDGAAVDAADAAADSSDGALPDPSDGGADTGDGAAPVDAAVDAAPLPGATTCAKVFSNATGVATSVAIDAAGDIVIAGTFNGTIDFGGGPLVAPSEFPGMFVAKLDSGCNHVWSRGYSNATASQRANAVAVDPTGNVFVTGAIQGVVDLGGGALPSSVGRGFFVLALDGAGAHRWSRLYGAGEGQALATDGAGNLALTGHAIGTIDFGGGVPANPGAQRIVIAKLDSTGAHMWSERFGATLGYGAGLASDATGGVLVVGAFSNGTLSLGGGPLVNPGGNVDAFTMRRDSAGAHLTSAAFRDTAGRDLVELFSGAAAMPSGDFAVSGRFMGTTDFGGGPLTVGGSSDTVVTRRTANGAHVWSKRFGAAGETHPGGIAVDPSNNVVVTGTLTGSADFGGGLFTSAGGTDAFLVKLDPSGAHVWSKRFGDGSVQAAHGVATDAAGNVVMVGHTKGTIDLGLGPVTQAGVMVARFAP